MSCDTLIRFTVCCALAGGAWFRRRWCPKRFCCSRPHRGIERRCRHLIADHAVPRHVAHTADRGPRGSGDHNSQHNSPPERSYGYAGTPPQMNDMAM